MACCNITFENFYIPVYILDSSTNIEQHLKIESEVQWKQEYEVHFIRNDDFIHSDAIHLMLIQNVIRTALDGDDDLIILATDSHRFTNQYNPNSFFSSIIEASNLGADILLGGALDFGNLIPLNSHLLWLDSFIGTSFIVVYKRSFERILQMSFKETKSISHLFSGAFFNKLIVWPFVSTTIGYSIDTYTSIEQRVETYIRILSKYNLKQIKI